MIHWTWARGHNIKIHIRTLNVIDICDHIQSLGTAREGFYSCCPGCRHKWQSSGSQWKLIKRKRQRGKVGRGINGLCTLDRQIQYKKKRNMMGIRECWMKGQPFFYWRSFDSLQHDVTPEPRTVPVSENNLGVCNKLFCPSQPPLGRPTVWKCWVLLWANVLKHLYTITITLRWTQVRAPRTLIIAVN